MKRFLIYIFGLLVLFLIWFNNSFIGQSEFKEYKIGDYSEYNEVQYVGTGGYAFIGKKESIYYLVENGVQKEGFTFLYGLTYSPDGKRWMALGWQGEDTCLPSLIIDGEITDMRYDLCHFGFSGNDYRNPHQIKEHSLYSFSPDSKRIAYVKPVRIGDGKNYPEDAVIMSIDGKGMYESPGIGGKDKYGIGYISDSKDVYDEINGIVFTPDSKDIFYTGEMHERPPGGFGFSQSTPLSRENKEGTYLLKNGIITKSEKDTKMYEVLRKQSWNEIFQSYEYEDNSNLYSTYQISKFFLKTKGSTIASTGKSLIGAVSDPILGTRIRVVGGAIANVPEINFQMGLILFIKKNVVFLSILMTLIVVVAFQLRNCENFEGEILFPYIILPIASLIGLGLFLFAFDQFEKWSMSHGFWFLGIFIILSAIMLIVTNLSSPSEGNLPASSIETEEEREIRRKKEEVRRKQEEQKKQEALIERRKKLLPDNYLAKFLQHAEIKYGRKDKYGNQNIDSLEKEIKEYLIMIAKQDTDQSVKYSVDAYLRGRNYPPLNDDYRWLVSTLRSKFIGYHEQKEQKFLSGEGVDFSSMSGIEFERYISRILEQKGYKVDLTPESGDQGADIIARIDDRVIVIQAKNYSKPVGNKAVQEVIGAIKYYDGTEGWVITNSTFTNSAKDLARVNGITLMEGFEGNQIKID